MEKWDDVDTNLHNAFFSFFDYVKYFLIISWKSFPCPDPATVPDVKDVDDGQPTNNKDDGTSSNDDTPAQKEVSSTLRMS